MQKKGDRTMFSYKIYLYENSKWTELKSWARPFTDGTSLDDTLDAGCINLSCTTRSEAIKPFIKLKIIISENGREVDSIYRLVASAKRTRRSYAPSIGTLYDWTINTIEITKELERRFIGTMTSTSYLYKDYSSGSARVVPEKNDNKNIWRSTPLLVEKNFITSPKKTGTVFEIPFFNWGIDESYAGIENPIIKEENANGLFARINESLSFGKNDMEIFSPSGSVIQSVEDYDGANKNSVSVTLTDVGIYKLVYSGNIGSPGDFVVTFLIAVFNELSEKTNPSISSVCKRLIRFGKPIRDQLATPEYRLDATFAQKYESVPAPEFSFTNCTLFDALSQVGGYIHAIPRLVPRATNDVAYDVTFDELGGSELAPDLPPMISAENTINIEDWCGTICSPAQNLCNTQDGINGAVTELGSDYITVRTEIGAVEINGDNILYRTSLPMKQVLKFECGFINEYDDGKTPVGDITAYLYEAAEYEALSSYWGTAYPYSKAWALCYASGGDTITGFNTKQKQATSIASNLGNTAIVNIINAVTGLSLSISDTDNGKWYRQLAFRITYIPIVTTQVNAVKPVLNMGGETKNELVYNQTANLAETSAFGAKMRGAIARLGQDVEIRTYDLFSYKQMPQIGQLLDGKYIAKVDAEYDITKIRVTLTLTKNFNQLSQYVGLNSNYRLFDVSEKQSVERFVHYSEKILVGRRARGGAQASVIVKNVAKFIAETIDPTQGASMTNDDNSTTASQKVQVAFVRGYTGEYNESTGRLQATPLDDRNVVLPVVAFPFGTSICFAFSYYDNYGAGYQANDNYENLSNFSVQRLVPYADGYGELIGIDFSMFSAAWDATIADQQDGGKAMLYPQIEGHDWTEIGALDTQDNMLLISKDSREKISVMYQCSFVATDDDIIVGEALAKLNPLVGGRKGNDATCRIVWLTHTINALDKYIDLGDGTVTTPNGRPTITLFTKVGATLRINSLTCPMDGVKAFAIERLTGMEEGNVFSGKWELLVGQNVELNEDDKTEPIYFTPVATDTFTI